MDISLTEKAYVVLRRELVTCRIRPGSRINISALQAKFSFSQGVVREALSRLSAEGLVEIERNRGFLAAAVSLTGYRHLIEATLVVELPCIRQSVEKGDTEWELCLVATYHRALRTLELVVAGKDGIDAYADARQRFYEALLSACDNPFLLRAWRLLYFENLRYRHLYRPLAEFELELNPHHEMVLKAVLARDTDRVLSLSIQNYERITCFIEQTAINERPQQEVGRVEPVGAD